jgi:Transcriptional regulator, AbiEi antitoxin
MPRESVSAPVIEGKRQTRERERPDDVRIGELARRQHGVVGRDQLMKLGLGEKAVEHRVTKGRLHPLHAGVYAVGHRLISKHGLWMAAVLASGPDALLSHGTAAALWGIRGYSGGAVHVTVPHKSTSTKRIRRHFSSVPPDERAVHEGIPVTSVHRAIFDLAATSSTDDVVAMTKEAEYLNHWDRLSLPDLLERYPGKRGSRNVRFALERLEEEPSGRKRQGLEERFAPSSAGTTSPYPASTTGSSSAPSATRSTATGRISARSSSSTGGRAIPPALPSRTTGLATERSG